MMELEQCLFPPPSCVCITDYPEDLGFPCGSAVIKKKIPWWLSGKDPPANAGDVSSVLGQEDPLEKEIATHSSNLPWEIT